MRMWTHTVTRSGHLMGKSVYHLPRMSLVPIHQPQRDGRFGWLRQETRTKNLESGPHDSLHLFRARSMSPSTRNGH